MKWMPKLTSTSKRATQIRKGALVMAAIAWVESVACCLIGGVSILSSLGEATIAVIGGLTAWAFYREVSDRYDGLAIVMLAGLGPLRHVYDGPSIGMNFTVVQVTVQLVMAPVAGLLVESPAVPANKVEPEIIPHDGAQSDV